MQNQSIWLNKSATASRYSCGESTLYRWIKERQFPKPVKISPGCARWRLVDLEAWEETLSH